LYRTQPTKQMPTQGCYWYLLPLLHLLLLHLLLLLLLLRTRNQP
jgi:hypothetical protein